RVQAGPQSKLLHERISNQDRKRRPQPQARSGIWFGASRRAPALVGQLTGGAVPASQRSSSKVLHSETGSGPARLRSHPTESSHVRGVTTGALEAHGSVRGHAPACSIALSSTYRTARRTAAGVCSSRAK